MHANTAQAGQGSEYRDSSSAPNKMCGTLARRSPVSTPQGRQCQCEHDHQVNNNRSQQQQQHTSPLPSSMLTRTAPTPRAKRKKARLPAPPSAPSQPDPVSEPYLVRAPPPVTAAPPETSNSGLILPSAYVRSVTQHRYAHGLVSPPSVMAGGSGENTPRPLPTPTPPAATQRDYVTGLLSPPFVVPGGRPSSPLPQPPVAPSRPPLPHTGSSSRSVNRGRELPPIGGRQSPMPSTSNANPPPPAEPPTPRRRRGGHHVVSGTISRRSTVRVSHHEHLQLSRQASMRRTNVWDGEFFCFC